MATTDPRVSEPRIPTDDPVETNRTFESMVEGLKIVPMPRRQATDVERVNMWVALAMAGVVAFVLLMVGFTLGDSMHQVTQPGLGGTSQSALWMPLR